MAAHAQAGAKRQKRDGKGDYVDYFQGIDKIEYNNMATPSETSSYRYYNNSERLHSRTMEEWLKYSISLTELRRDSDKHIRPSHPRPWEDHTNTTENRKRCIKALFDLCSKLGVKYWTALDTDLVPWTDSWEEGKGHWEDVVEYIQELTQRYHVKLLWLAPDLHSHSRYVSGAFTSNDATTFIHAAAQIKRCLEVSQRLNAECFLLWPYNEGYETIFHTDVAREIKLFAKLLKITAEYKDRLNFRCQLLIMPYCRDFSGWQHSQRDDHRINMYMWDVTSCLYMLKSYNLDRNYKVVTTPGHQLYMANVYNMLGGVTITNELNHYDNKTLALMMKCIVDQSASPAGGVSLRLGGRRGGDVRELVTLHLKYMDAAARALRLACALAADHLFTKHLQQRYATYYSGFGSRLVSTDITMEECEEYHKKNHNPHGDATTKYEHLDIVLQRRLDACDHI